MTDYAHVGRKVGCGCAVFARLDGKGIRGSASRNRKTGTFERYPSGLNIHRVPLEDANLTVCRCS